MRAQLADDPADVAAQLDRRGQRAVAVAEEAHVAHPDLLGGLDLLGAPDGGDLGPVDSRVEAARVAVGAHAVDDLDARAGPGRDGAGGAEVDVVGVGRDDQRPLDLGVVQHWRSLWSRGCAVIVGTRPGVSGRPPRLPVR
jgi:hypothetical protein